MSLRSAIWRHGGTRSRGRSPTKMPDYGFEPSVCPCSCLLFFCFLNFCSCLLSARPLNSTTVVKRDARNHANQEADVKRHSLGLGAPGRRLLIRIARLPHRIFGDAALAESARRSGISAFDMLLAESARRSGERRRREGLPVAASPGGPLALLSPPQIGLALRGKQRKKERILSVPFLLFKKKDEGGNNSYGSCQKYKME